MISKFIVLGSNLQNVAHGAIELSFHLFEIILQNFAVQSKRIL